MLVRPLGYPEIEVRFAQSQELSTDVGAPFGPEGRPIPPPLPQAAPAPMVSPVVPAPDGRADPVPAASPGPRPDRTGVPPR